MEIRVASGILHEVGYVSSGEFVPNMFPLLIGKIVVDFRIIFRGNL
jgi:hypothetical protein